MSYFTSVSEKVPFEGKKSDNPLAFKFYDENLVVRGKTLKEHLRFAVAYWHTFCGTGGDPFGPGTQLFPWDASSDPMEAAKARMDAAFEFITKLGAPFYCFHDTDVAGDGTVFEIENRLAKLVEIAKQKQAESG